MKAHILKIPFNHIEDGKIVPFAPGDDISHLPTNVKETLVNAGHIEEGKEDMKEDKKEAKK